MSGPSTTEAEREAMSRRLGALTGGLVGAVLAWYLWAIGAGALRGNQRNRR